jgi:ketosteroid isomerase-like protein
MRSALDVVQAWGQAMASFDERALIALADEEIEIVAPGGTRQGHEALRVWLKKQTYGVAPHFEQRRHFVRDDTVGVDLHVEYRYVDGGEVAGSADAAIVFAIRDGLVLRITAYPDLASALASARLDEADDADSAQ